MLRLSPKPLTNPNMVVDSELEDLRIKAYVAETAKGSRLPDFASLQKRKKSIF